MNDRTYAVLIGICAVIFIAANALLAREGAAPQPARLLCEFVNLCHAVQ
jgi:hypothetical protein